MPVFVKQLGAVPTTTPTSAFLLDDTHAVMTEDTCAKLSRYDTTNPSGVYEGKVWRCMNWLCWYAPGEKPETCDIESREILVVAGGSR